MRQSQGSRLSRRSLALPWSSSPRTAVQSDTYIVLAAHDGERFIADQIESIRNQDHKDWVLLIGDDGSSDGTLSVIDRYAERDPRIEVSSYSGEPVGSPMRNFSRLLEEAHSRGARHVLCCDQDDVWLPRKFSTVLTAFEEFEKDDGTPLLIHHDLEVVDENRKPIAASYWRSMRISPGTESSPGRLLSRNEVTGCAMACNRALLAVALPVPEAAVMHDWWLALCAAFMGKLRFVDDTLVRYRQHGSNVIGAKSFWRCLSPVHGLRATWHRGNREFIETLEQAAAFQERFGRDCALSAFDAVEIYATILGRGRFQRLIGLYRSGAWRRHWVLDSMLFLRLMLAQRRG